MNKAITITATEFKARCLKIMDDLEARRIDSVTVTKRGKPSVLVTAPKDLAWKPLHGAHSGKIWIAPDVDLTGPVVPLEDWGLEEPNIP